MKAADFVAAVTKDNGAGRRRRKKSQGINEEVTGRGLILSRIRIAGGEGGGKGKGDLH